LNNWLAEDSDRLESVSWKIVSKEFYEAMKADIEGGYVAYYIIIFLVCIGVLNTVLMSVLERTGEFGVLKAIGTSPKRLFALIMAETMLLSGLSCIAGFLLFVPLNIWLVNTGFVLPEPIEFTGVVMSHMQGTWNPTVLYEPALIILISTLVISIIPARRAAKIVPVEAMRSL
jgi:ABC-type lipoprotein release transport system permease subunit